MSLYASTYISGLKEPIECWIKKLYNNNVEIINNLDGLILYKTNHYVNAPFFNNTFLCLHNANLSLGGGVIF